MVRGIRNKNPGNLRITHIDWKGKVPITKNTDGEFEQFTTMELGIRAMMMDLIHDIKKDGKDTVRKLLEVYAPKEENNLEAYIKTVCHITGFEEDDVLMVNEDTISKLVAGMSFVENGGYLINNKQIAAAWVMI